MLSAVMPVKNGARFIGSALRSLLDQGEVVAQVIVVDDGSTDGTADVVAAVGDPRIRLVANAGRPGISGGRNTGTALATEDWLYYFDADDLVRPGALPALMSAAAANPDVGLVFGDYDRIDEAGRPVGSRRMLRSVRSKPTGNVLTKALTGNFMIVGAQIVRRDVLGAIGGFDESIRYCEDWHAWCRLAARTPFHFVDGLVVLEYRLHGASTVHRRIPTLADFEPGIASIFADPAIVAQVDASERARLRREAEAHLLGYIATEAVRMRRYGTAVNAAGQAIARVPRLAPRTLARVGGALAGL